MAMTQGSSKDSLLKLWSKWTKFATFLCLFPAYLSLPWNISYLWKKTLSAIANSSFCTHGRYQQVTLELIPPSSMSEFFKTKHSIHPQPTATDLHTWVRVFITFELELQLFLLSWSGSMHLKSGLLEAVPWLQRSFS